MLSGFLNIAFECCFYPLACLLVKFSSTPPLWSPLAYGAKTHIQYPSHKNDPLSNLIFLVKNLHSLKTDKEPSNDSSLNFTSITKLSNLPCEASFYNFNFIIYFILFIQKERVQPFVREWKCALAFSNILESQRSFII